MKLVSKFSRKSPRLHVCENILAEKARKEAAAEAGEDDDDDDDDDIMKNTVPFIQKTYEGDL